MWIQCGVYCIRMPITKDDIAVENGKEYLAIRYANGNLELIKNLTEKLGYDGDFEKTLMLSLAALREIANKKVVQLNESYE